MNVHGNFILGRNENCGHGVWVEFGYIFVISVILRSFACVADAGVVLPLESSLRLYCEALVKPHCAVFIYIM